eukprot:gnl/Dysnectes_brevis/5266_a7501_389.p1 GENE.gnl/Dysnectes_brevis/5266_a7501_389~~gnl/Dysnectes_brevis/5266_a7501_389.p1  ORF type:complete len:1162 (-),score=126.14 gnl/Dysnectes_brevis/5266_a7501_389:428-3688(-)
MQADGDVFIQAGDTSSVSLSPSLSLGDSESSTLVLNSTYLIADTLTLSVDTLSLPGTLRMGDLLLEQGSKLTAEDSTLKLKSTGTTPRVTVDSSCVFAAGNLEIDTDTISSVSGVMQLQDIYFMSGRISGASSDLTIHSASSLKLQGDDVSIEGDLEVEDVTADSVATSTMLVSGELRCDDIGSDLNITTSVIAPSAVIGGVELSSGVVNTSSIVPADGNSVAIDQLVFSGVTIDTLSGSDDIVLLSNISVGQITTDKADLVIDSDRLIVTGSVDTSSVSTGDLDISGAITCEGGCVLPGLSLSEPLTTDSGSLKLTSATNTVELPSGTSLKLGSTLISASGIQGASGFSIEADLDFSEVLLGTTTLKETELSDTSGLRLRGGSGTSQLLLSGSTLSVVNSTDTGITLEGNTVLETATATSISTSTCTLADGLSCAAVSATSQVVIGSVTVTGSSGVLTASKASFGSISMSESVSVPTLSSSKAISVTPGITTAAATVTALTSTSATVNSLTVTSLTSSSSISVDVDITSTSDVTASSLIAGSVTLSDASLVSTGDLHVSATNLTLNGLSKVTLGGMMLTDSTVTADDIVLSTDTLTVSTDNTNNLVMAWDQAQSTHTISSSSDSLTVLSDTTFSSSTTTTLGPGVSFSSTGMSLSETLAVQGSLMINGSLEVNGSLNLALEELVLGDVSLTSTGIVGDTILLKTSTGVGLSVAGGTLRPIGLSALDLGDCQAGQMTIDELHLPSTSPVVHATSSGITTTAIRLGTSGLHSGDIVYSSADHRVTVPAELASTALLVTGSSPAIGSSTGEVDLLGITVSDGGIYHTALTMTGDGVSLVLNSSTAVFNASLEVPSLIVAGNTAFTSNANVLKINALGDYDSTQVSGTLNTATLSATTLAVSTSISLDAKVALISSPSGLELNSGQEFNKVILGDASASAFAATSLTADYLSIDGSTAVSSDSNGIVYSAGRVSGALDATDITLSTLPVVSERQQVTATLDSTTRTVLDDTHTLQGGSWYRVQVTSEDGNNGAQGYVFVPLDEASCVSQTIPSFTGGDLTIYVCSNQIVTWSTSSSSWGQAVLNLVKSM